jgi:hypothetical protein
MADGSRVNEGDKLMQMTLIEERGLAVLEGQDGEPFITQAGDARELLEACFAHGVRAVMLYAPNLPASFFDLSSGVAGSMLQTLQNYRVRLAVICPPETVHLSSRFGELLAETQRAGDFGIFATRAAARAWFAQHHEQS